MTDELDPWLTTAQAAELAGMDPSSWRKLWHRGTGPAPDDPGDPDVHERRRTLRWRRSTVVRYMGARRAHRGTREPGDV